jgi:hypothetical protein
VAVNGDAAPQVVDDQCVEPLIAPTAVLILAALFTLVQIVGALTKSALEDVTAFRARIFGKPSLLLRPLSDEVEFTRRHGRDRRFLLSRA